MIPDPRTCRHGLIGHCVFAKALMPMLSIDKEANIFAGSLSLESAEFEFVGVAQELRR